MVDKNIAFVMGCIAAFLVVFAVSWGLLTIEPDPAPCHGYEEGMSDYDFDSWLAECIDHHSGAGDSA